MTLTIQDINSVAVFLKLCKNFTLLIGGRAGYKGLELFVFSDLGYTILLFKRKIFPTIYVWVLNFENVRVLDAELQNERLGRIVFVLPKFTYKISTAREVCRIKYPFLF